MTVSLTVEFCFLKSKQLLSQIRTHENQYYHIVQNKRKLFELNIQSYEHEKRKRYVYSST